MPQGTYADRVMATLAARPDGNGALRDADGAAVEDFGLPLNLMLSCSVTFASSKTEALEILAKLLQAAPRQ